MATTRTAISARRRFAILQRDGFRCRYCGRTADQVKLHVDHVVPVAAGGSNDDSNLVAACADCNLGKADIPLGPIAESGLRCSVCERAAATYVHLVPYALYGAEAVLACDDCDPDGYDIPIAEWRDPVEGPDWRQHLATTKEGGQLLVHLVDEAIGG